MDIFVHHHQTKKSMLIKDFYNQIICNQEDKIINCSIKLNPNHEVYKGHFPQQSVVPGVIQLQIAKELLEEKMKLTLLMDDIVQVKYLNPIIPEGNTVLKFEIILKENNLSVIKTNINIATDELVFTKARINFKIID